MKGITTCREPECDTTDVIAKGLCWKHYRRQLRHGDTSTVLSWKRNPLGVTRLCSEPGCDLVHHAKGFCSKHYYEMKKRRNEGDGADV